MKITLATLKEAIAAGKADKVASSPTPTGLVAMFDSAGNLNTSDKVAADLVSSRDVANIVSLAQAEYDALSPVDASMLYLIVEA